MGENKIGKDTQKYDVCEIGGELFIVKNCVRFITGKNGMTYEVHLKVTRPVNPDPKTVAEFRRYCGVLADKLEQKRALKEQHDNEGA
jgi:hypothetical protein